MKKIITMLMAVILVFGVMPTAVFAKGAAQIISPVDGEWIDPSKTVNITWYSNYDSGYKITIRNVDTGEYIANKQDVTGNSYTLWANTLDTEQQYLIILYAYTFKGNSISVDEDSIYVYTEGEPESDFSVWGVSMPEGSIEHGRGLSIGGIIESLYPIEEAKILITSRNNKNDVKQIKHVTGYNSCYFDIAEYDYDIKFGSLEPGAYIYRVIVKDTEGTEYTAVESNFNVAWPVGVYKDVKSGHTNYYEIKYLSEQGVISGDGNGAFRPNDSITRAEFVKMMCVAFELSGAYGTLNFNDIDNQHWAYNYILTAFSKKIVNGKGNGRFSPEDKVTFQEAAKMLVCIKGWESNANQQGGWPNGYTTVAQKNGIFNKTSVASNKGYSKNASRADVAQMFYNALTSSGGLIAQNLPRVSFIKQDPKTCKATAAAQAANLIVGSNMYTTNSMRAYEGQPDCKNLEGVTYKGSDGKTYVTTCKSDGYVGTIQEQQEKINEAIAFGLPIIVTVHTTTEWGTKHHWVTIVGKKGDTYEIVDPATGTKTTMKDFNYDFGLADYSDGYHYGYISYKQK